MKSIYTAVMNQLKANVPELKWIELNFGQLKQIGDGVTLPLQYPAALIGVSLSECKDITYTVQDCQGEVSISLVFDPIAVGQSTADATEDDRNKALKPYEVISDVYKALQGFESPEFGALSRTSQGEDYHNDSFVYKINFVCDFEDLTADVD